MTLQRRAQGKPTKLRGKPAPQNIFICLTNLDMQQQSKATASGLPRGQQRVKGAGGATETGQHFVACLAVFA